MTTKGWRYQKLRDLTTKIGSGATPRGGSNSYKPSGISLIRSQNVLDLAFSNEGLAFIDDEQAMDLQNVTVGENDVLLNITGDSVARACKVPKQVLPARVNQHVAIIRPDAAKLDSDFLLYYLQLSKQHLLSISEIGGTRRALTKGMIEDLDVYAPDLTEQESIASVLRSLDDKIDLLHRQNATLEAMAETLFRQWFVEEAKEEWGEGNIYEFVEVVYGYPFKSELFNKAAKGLPLIRIRDLRNGRSDVYTDEECDEKYRISTGDLLAGMDGEFKLYIWSGGESLLNQRVCKFLPKHDFVPHLYVFGLMKPHLHYYEKTKVGTTVIHLGKSDLDEIRISIPDEQVLRAFGDVTNPIFDKLKNNFTQIRTLVALRDMLLPKLMCGEIRLDGVLMEMSNIVRQSNM
jgi:type I restriction enzyme S subunit